MASKRFKGMLCAYCCENDSSTGDHIFAREFFLKEQRANLPQAPSCVECNNKKSKLEHYLTTVLPFAGRHGDSRANLAEYVPKRLNKNIKLHKFLHQEKFEATLIEDGVKSKAMAMPIREGSIESLFTFVVKGLAWHHWGVYLSSAFPVEVLALTDAGQKVFQNNFFSWRAKNREWVNLGDGTVIYEGLQGIDLPEVTVWRFHMYGGMLLTDDSGASTTEIGAMSGPKKVMSE